LDWQRRQPRLAVRGDGKRHSADHLRLIDQARAAPLNESDPAQALAFHDRHAHEFLRFIRQLLQDRPREIGNACGQEHALPHDRKSQREAVEASFRLLLHPSHATEGGKETMRGALLQPQPLADDAEAIRARLLGEELDELKAPLQQGIDDLHRSGMAFRIRLCKPSRHVSSLCLTFRLDLEYRYTSQRETQEVLRGAPARVAGVGLPAPGPKRPRGRSSLLRHPITSRPAPRTLTTEETMRATHESQPFAQRSTARRSSWWQRAADLIAALALVVAMTPMALAQPVEISYNTFLDPNNASDPRAAAQAKMIAEFERQNPNIKVRVVVDPTGANGARTLRTHAHSPDVVRATSFQMPEYVATGALLQLDDLVKRDKIDQNDWLVPLSAGMVEGRLFGLQQDYRIPLLIYRKRLLEEAKVTPPRTWTDVCETGAKLSKNNVVGYAIPIGTTGGIGGAQAFGELHLSTLLAAPDGKYFADDNKTIA